jgi:hypothetical protein
MTPFLPQQPKNPLPWNPDLRGMDDLLTRASDCALRLVSPGHQDELLAQTASEGLSETFASCIECLSIARLHIVDSGTELRLDQLASLEDYRRKVREFFHQLNLQSGVYDWRLRTLFYSRDWLKANGVKLALVGSLLCGIGVVTYGSTRLIFLPSIPSQPGLARFETEAPASRHISAQAGSDSFAEKGDTFEVFAHGFLIARKGSSGVARPDSNLVIADGAEARVYGIAYAYKGANVTVYPGGHLYAEPGTNVTDLGGEVTRLSPAEWPLSFRRQ